MNRPQFIAYFFAMLAFGGLLCPGVALANGKPEVQSLVAAGGYHSLALCDSGNIWGWGLNENGQLGDGTRVRRDVPFPLKPKPESLKIVGLAAGEDHSLALGEDGSVWTFGLNHDGQLGIGTTIDQPVMTEVKGLKNIVQVGGGQKHSMALNRDGRVWAWGSNDCGQLGKSKLSVSMVPLEIAGLKGIVSVAVGWRHTLALKKDGSVWEWGAVEHRKDGTIEFKEAPRRVQGLGIVRMISAGGRHSLALLNDGTVWAWGNNEYGQLGNGTNEPQAKPIQVNGIAHAHSISAGYDHCAVLLGDHTVLTWGDNNFGQLGNPTCEASSVPVPVVGINGPLKNIETVRCGGYHTLFITSESLLLACGNNSFGQLGDWKFKDSTLPNVVYKQIYQLRGKTTP